MALSNRTNDPSIRRRAMPNEGTDHSFDVKYKVLLLGDSRVGKSSLQRFIAGKDFRPDIGSTIGVDFVNKVLPVEKAKVNLQIWDTAGQRNFRTIGRGYYAGTKAFVLVYDVTNLETFQLIEHFSQMIENAKLDTERRYLIANKIDLVEDRKVDEDAGRRFALRNSMIYFETSCKTGENVLELFEQIASDLVRQYNPKILESHLPIGNNFAFNYRSSLPGANHDLGQTSSSTAVQSQGKKKKKTPFSFFSYQSVDGNGSSSLCSFLCCCKPGKGSANT